VIVLVVGTRTESEGTLRHGVSPFLRRKRASPVPGGAPFVVVCPAIAPDQADRQGILPGPPGSAASRTCPPNTAPGLHSVRGPTTPGYAVAARHASSGLPSCPLLVTGCSPSAHRPPRDAPPIQRGGEDHRGAAPPERRAACATPTRRAAWAVSAIAAQFRVRQDFSSRRSSSPPGAEIAKKLLRRAAPARQWAGRPAPPSASTPLDDQEFHAQALHADPLDGSSISQTTWPIPRLPLYLENLNWVSNAQPASGPHPEGRACVPETSSEASRPSDVAGPAPSSCSAWNERSEAQGSPLPAERHGQGRDRGRQERLRVPLDEAGHGVDPG